MIEITYDGSVTLPFEEFTNTWENADEFLDDLMNKRKGLHAMAPISKIIQGGKKYDRKELYHVGVENAEDVEAFLRRMSGDPELHQG